MKLASLLFASAAFSLLLLSPSGAEAALENSAPGAAREMVELRSALEDATQELSAARIELAQTSTTVQPMTPTQAARVELKLTQYEEELRRLTGRVEELSYRLDQLSRRLELLVSDVDSRLSRLEGAPGAAAGAAGGAEMATAAPSGAAPSGAAGGTAAAGTAATAGSGPRTLGTINAGDVAALQRQTQSGQQPNGQQQAAIAESGGGLPKDQYQRAYDLLAQQRWAEAETAFRSFLKEHPGDALAPNATYWLAETYYARKDYTSAATLFAEGFEKYPNGQKAPDNLLKLGISLANIGRKQDACDTLAALKERYPNAAPTILQRADRQRSDLGC